MKTYKISSKVYVSLAVPISDNETLVIPKKGEIITRQFKEIPYGLKLYQSKNIIVIEEI